MRRAVPIFVLAPVLAAVAALPGAPPAPGADASPRDRAFTGWIGWVSVHVHTDALTDLGLPSAPDSLRSLAPERLLDAGAADHATARVRRGTYLVGEQRVRSQPDAPGPGYGPIIYDPDVPEILLLRPETESYLVAPRTMIPGVGRPFRYEGISPAIAHAPARDTIAGFPAEAWDIDFPEGWIRVWTGDVPALGADTHRVARALATLAAGRGRRIGAALAVVEHGFPLRILQYAGDEITVEAVTAIEPGPVPRERLAPPEGFRRVEPGG